MNWKGKNVLVCGGCGMIGHHLARRLLYLGADVTVVDNLSSGSEKNIRDIRKDLVEFRPYDLRDPNQCLHFASNKDVIFQLAARMGGIGYITTHFADVMHDSALVNINMLEAAHVREVPLYFYSSSACIYPNYKQTVSNVVALKESDALPADPNEPYGYEKLFTEVLCDSYHRDYNMNIRIARFHNIYGNGYTSFDMEKGKAPAHLIIKAIKHPNPPFTIWGRGDATRSFCYINDCIDGVLKLIESNYTQPINIGSDRLISVNDLAQLVVDTALRDSGKEIVPLHDLTKPVGVQGRNSDNTLAKQVLNWSPRISLEEGLTEVYNWAREHYTELEGI